MQNWPGNMRNQAFQENCKTTEYSFPFFQYTLLSYNPSRLHPPISLLLSVTQQDLPSPPYLLLFLSLQERAGFTGVSDESCRIETRHKSSNQGGMWQPSRKKEVQRAGGRIREVLLPLLGVPHKSQAKQPQRRAEDLVQTHAGAMIVPSVTLPL